jgi:hypothetical protein
MLKKSKLATGIFSFILFAVAGAADAATASTSDFAIDNDKGGYDCMAVSYVDNDDNMIIAGFDVPYLADGESVTVEGTETYTWTNSTYSTTATFSCNNGTISTDYSYGTPYWSVS